MNAALKAASTFDRNLVSRRLHASLCGSNFRPIAGSVGYDPFSGIIYVKPYS